VTAPLLILAAVEGELGGLPGELREARTEIVGGRSIRAGILHDLPVRLVVSGPGMANAVHAAAVAVRRERPRGILAIGCAGAFVAAGLDIGDVAAGTAAVDLHLGLESPDGAVVPVPLPFSVLPGGGSIAADPPGRYPCDAPWTQAAADALARAWSARTVRVGVGPILTVSTVTTTDERAAALFRELRPVMEAMEGAGAAHVAALHGLPFLEIRAAANRVGRRDRETWDLPLAFRRCGEAVRAMLRAGAVPE
jgi:futalosine hydrolase